MTTLVDSIDLSSDSVEVVRAKQKRKQPHPVAESLISLSRDEIMARMVHREKADMYQSVYASLDHWICNLEESGGAEFWDRFLYPQIVAYVREERKVWTTTKTRRRDMNFAAFVAIERSREDADDVDDIGSVSIDEDSGASVSENEKKRKQQQRVRWHLSTKELFAFISYYPRTIDHVIQKKANCQVYLIEPHIARRALHCAHFAALRVRYNVPPAFSSLGNVVAMRSMGNTLQMVQFAEDRAVPNWIDRVFPLSTIHRLATESGLVRGLRAATDVIATPEVLLDDSEEAESSEFSDNTMGAMCRENAAKVAVAVETSNVGSGKASFVGSESEAALEKRREHLDALETGVRRGISSASEFYDRLHAPGAEKRLIEMFGDVTFMAFGLFVSVAGIALDKSFRQADLFYLYELGRYTQHYGDNKKAAEQIAAMLKQKLLLVEPGASNVPDAPTLLRLLGQSKRNFGREMVANLFRDFDIPTLISLHQDTRGERLRFLRTITTPSLVVGLPQLGAYLNDNALVFQSARVNDILSGYAKAGKKPAVFSISINNFRAKTGGDEILYDSTERLLANKTRPLSVLTALRFFLPSARDGVDYLVVWSPLAYTAKAEQQQAQVVYNIQKRARGRPTTLKRDTEAQSPTSVSAPELFVLMNDTQQKIVYSALPALTLLQRATARAEVNQHLPLAAPMVARLMATSEDVPSLCLALNAFGALLGINVPQWRHESERARMFAQSTARLIVRLFDYWFDDGADIAKFESAFYWTVDQCAARRSRVAELSKTDLRAETIKQRSVLDAVVVLLDANTLPVVCSTQAFDFLYSTVLPEIQTRYNTDRSSTTDAERRLGSAIELAKERQDQRLRQDCWHAKHDSRTRTEGQHDSDDARTERQVRFHEAVQARRDGGAAAYATRLCPCGAVTGAECVRMTRARTRLLVGEHLCCLCTLTFDIGHVEKHNIRHRHAADICHVCRSRFLSARSDRDEEALPGNVEIFSRVPYDNGADLYAQYAPGIGISFTDMCDTVLVYAAKRPELRDQVLEFFGSLGNRVRWWRTAPVRLSSFCSKKAARFADKAREQLAGDLAKNYMQGDLATDELALRQQWLASLVSSKKLGESHATILKNTELMLGVGGAVNYDEPAPKEYDSLALALSMLELAAIGGTLALYNGRRGWNSVLAKKETVLANRAVTRVMYMPLTCSAELRAYEIAYNRRAMRYFPLTESPMGDVSTLGSAGGGIVSNMSDWRRDWTERLAGMITEFGEPKPLTGTLPLLTELVFLNYHNN